jgi:hypothetical protein
LVQGGGVAVEPAEIENIGRGNVVVDRTVIAAVRPDLREAVGHLESVGNLAHRHAVIDHAQSLVVDEAIEVALAFQKCDYLVVPPSGPMMLSEDHIDLVAPHDQSLVQVLRPRERLTDFGAPERVGVVERMGRIFGSLHRLLFLDKPHHLGGRLRTGRHQELVG